MATLFYAVFDGAAAMATGPVLNEGTVAISGTSAQSGVMDSAGGNKPRCVRVMADTDCFVTWGENPTALTDGTEGRPVGAENPEYFPLLANEKLAVIERA